MFVIRGDLYPFFYPQHTISILHANHMIVFQTHWDYDSTIVLLFFAMCQDPMMNVLDPI